MSQQKKLCAQETPTAELCRSWEGPTMHVVAQRMGIDPTQDRECVHPPNTSNNCYAKMKKTEAGALSSTLIPGVWNSMQIVHTLQQACEGW